MLVALYKIYLGGPFFKYSNKLAFETLYYLICNLNLSISSAGSAHHNISHTSHQGHNGQHALREEASGIHTKNSSHLKKC